MSVEQRAYRGVAGKWWVLAAVGVGTFMSALDGSVVNTVLPVVRQAFGVDVAAVEWVVVIYLLVASGLLLSFGRLGDLWGHKPVYLAGFGLFVLGSALCGLAPTVNTLVASRGLQALGAAMLFSNGPAILTRSFPATERGRALGLQATMTYLGLTTGPSFGGWLAQQYGWRSVFYINVPVGALAILLSLRFIPYARPERRGERFDIAGAVTFLAGLVALLLALNQGHAWGWTSVPVVALAAAAAAALAGFIAIERRSGSPMLDLSLFRARVFSAATVSALLNYICLYFITFLLPFYLIQGRGLTPARAGLLLTAEPVLMAVISPLSGALSDRVGSRALSTVGMVIIAVGSAMLARLGPASALSGVVLGLAVVGLGMGLFASPNTSALMGAAPRVRQGIAAGILATARNLGMVLGVGLAGAILTTVQAGTPEVGEAVFVAVRVGLLVAAALALVGAAVAAARGESARVEAAAAGRG